MAYPVFVEPQDILVNSKMLVGPNPEDAGIALETGPNIRPLPRFPALAETLEGPVLLKVGDNVSTDEIMPAGAKVLPFRSNIPAISEFVFAQIDPEFYKRALPYREQGFFVVGGVNYGQGSSREHAALAPRYLGLRAVLAKSFARIHYGNLANFGIVPLVFVDPENWNDIRQEDVLRIESLRAAIAGGPSVIVENVTRGRRYETLHGLTKRQCDAVLAGGLINCVKPGRLH